MVSFTVVGIHTGCWDTYYFKITADRCPKPPASAVSAGRRNCGARGAYLTLLIIRMKMQPISANAIEMGNAHT